MANAVGKSAARSRATRLCAWLAVIVAADQITKSIIVSSLQFREGQRVDFFEIGGQVIGFSLARNSGAAFSRLQGYTPLLAVGAIVIAVVLARTLRKSNDLATTIGLVMVLGGALGNLSDRFFRAPGFLRGHVVDFVQVGSFPLFNIADSCVSIGAVVIAARSFMVSDHETSVDSESGPTSTRDTTDAETNSSRDESGRSGVGRAGSAS